MAGLHALELHIPGSQGLLKHQGIWLALGQGGAVLVDDFLHHLPVLTVVGYLHPVLLWGILEGQLNFIVSDRLLSQVNVKPTVIYILIITRRRGPPGAGAAVCQVGCGHSAVCAAGGDRPSFRQVDIGGLHPTAVLSRHHQGLSYAL